MRSANEIIQRYENNPILVPKEGSWWESKSVFNCATLCNGKGVQVLYRAVGEYQNYISRIGYAYSTDGYSFIRNDKPVFEPVESYERYGVEDPRLFSIDSQPYFTYVVPSNYVRESPVVSSALATTDNFVEFKRLGIITPEVSDDKDLVFFPERMTPILLDEVSSDSKCYLSLHRPTSWVGSPYGVDRPSIWLAESSNLTNFQKFSLLLKPEQDWEAAKVGPGPPPIRTRQGWLLIYHGVSSSKVYRAGAALLDLNQPNKVLGRCTHPILEPEKEYEVHGDVNNVVFPTGACVIDEKLLLYYGAADKVCCLATADLDDLVEYVLEHS